MFRTTEVIIAFVLALCLGGALTYNHIVKLEAQVEELNNELDGIASASFTKCIRYKRESIQKVLRDVNKKEG